MSNTSTVPVEIKAELILKLKRPEKHIGHKVVDWFNESIYIVYPEHGGYNGAVLCSHKKHTRFEWGKNMNLHLMQ